MEQQTKEEKKNKAIGIITAVGIHAVLLIVFFFVIAWTIPNPPLPGAPGGMEINLGFVEAGMGDDQTNVLEETEETPVEEVEQEEVTEEAIVNEEKVVTTENESPHEIKVPEKETKKEKTEPVKEKKEVVDSKNTFPNKKASESDGNKNVKGDQGKPEGNPDSRNMFPGGKGNGQGTGNGDGPGGNGASMDLPGWEWDEKPNKWDPTSESGYVLFEFFIDEDGNVVGAKKINGANLTPSEDNFYKNQLLNLSFHLKDPKAKPAQKTRGVFRFEVRSR
jgi:periplasmic protein TonB